MRELVVLVLLGVAACGPQHPPDARQAGLPAPAASTVPAATATHASAPLAPVQLQAPPAQPGAYVSCDAQMSIVFPGGAAAHPEVQEPMVQKEGPFELTTQVVATKGDQVAFTVTWTDYPHSVVQRKGARRILRDIERGTLRATGPLESDQELEVQGMPALLFTHTYSSHPGRSRALWILRGDRAYEVLVVAENRATIDDPATRDFFDSFRLASCAH
jgi:hypothetical protein